MLMPQVARRLNRFYVFYSKIDNNEFGELYHSCGFRSFGSFATTLW